MIGLLGTLIEETFELCPFADECEEDTAAEEIADDGEQRAVVACWSRGGKLAVEPKGL